MAMARRHGARLLARALRQLQAEAPPQQAAAMSTAAGRYVPPAGPSFSGRTSPTSHRSAQGGLAAPWPGQRRGMFIQMQPTPNPASMMFLPGRPVMESGSANFGNAREAMTSPLARKLFAADGVRQVFFGSDFVTVTKADDASWTVLKPDILAAIADHISSGEPLLLEGKALAASDTAIHEDDSEVVAMIKELLETRIRPSVQEDGGDILYKGFDEESGTVTLKMQGACSGCPSSSVTLKSGIENMLMHYIPEVREVVEAEPDEHEDVALREFAKLEAQLSP